MNPLRLDLSGLIFLGEGKEAAREAREEAGRLELRAIEVNVAMTEDDLAERVSGAFGL